MGNELPGIQWFQIFLWVFPILTHNAKNAIFWVLRRKIFKFLHSEHTIKGVVVSGKDLFLKRKPMYWSIGLNLTPFCRE